MAEAKKDTLSEGLLGDEAFAAEDKRYPNWHKWLSADKQKMLANAIYVPYAIWLILYFACKAVPAINDKLAIVVSLIPVLYYLMAFGLVVGMVSNISISTKLSATFLGLMFLCIALWPRLAVPAFGGIVGPFCIYLCLTVIWDDGVIGWKAFHCPGYMATVGPAFACINMLMFKGWCYGYLPKIIYWTFFMILMVSGTVKELNKAKEDKDTSGFDYRVNIPVFANLVPFRVAVLTVALGTAITSSQEQLLFLLKDDVWQCTPLPF